MSDKSEKEIKTFKDIKNFEEIDLDKYDLVRVETPGDIKEKCLQLCKDYLSGNWLRQTVDTIEVRRLSGGLTNQMYYCGITTPLTDSQDIPQEVAIRLYGPKYFNNSDCNGNERLTDVVIALLVSKNKLGPKIYGLFEGGQIQEYYKHRQFCYEEQKDPKLVTEVFQKLARIHAMEVPINRNTDWVFTEWNKFYSDEFKKYPINDLIQELNCETLMNRDIKAEIVWLKELIVKIKAPIVFTHSDYRSSNILVLEDMDTNDNNSDQIVVCDYESSCYGYRGSDFGSIFQEWGQKTRNINTYMNSDLDYTKLKPLLEIYIAESERIFGKTYSENKINSLENILNEIKILSLVSAIFGMTWTLKNDPDSHTGFPLDRKSATKFAEIRFKNYFTLKKQLMDENIISE